MSKDPDWLTSDVVQEVEPNNRIESILVRTVDGIEIEIGECDGYIGLTHATNWTMQGWYGRPERRMVRDERFGVNMVLIAKAPPVVMKYNDRSVVEI